MKSTNLVVDMLFDDVVMSTVAVHVQCMIIT